MREGLLYKPSVGADAYIGPLHKPNIWDRADVGINVIKLRISLVGVDAHIDPLCRLETSARADVGIGPY